MFGGLMTKQQHNINCINRILGLNIPQITQAVRNAIRKHNIFDGDRPTNADLLKIVFECLTVYLENLNLQHISANEHSLIEEINRIGEILEIVNVGRCLQYVDYRFRISNFLSRKISDNMVSLTLSGVYLEAEKAFKNQEKHLYAKMLDLITSVTQVTHEKPENALTPSQVKFWFENVIPLIFDKNSDIQKSATTAVEAALPFIRLTSFQEHPNWPALEERIIKEYADIIITSRDSGNSLWYKMWNVVVKLLHKKLLKGGVIINKFLSICESGFKSLNYTTRAETFLCWKVLLEIYSQDTKYLSAKRIKLLLIPFKPITKTSQIALNKFLVWWSLICKVDNQIDQYYDTVLTPFLWFCFGLSEKPILSHIADPSCRQEVFPELTALSITGLINLLGPVSEVTRSFCKSHSIEEIREPLAMPGLLKSAGQFLINSCGEATYLLKDTQLVDAMPICENMWSNMMSRMNGNTDITLTELLVQNLNLLAKSVTQNDEPAIKLVTQASAVVLSSNNLIPANASDDATMGILKRIAQLLTNSSIQINENTMRKIVENIFHFPAETKALQLQLQQLTTLLKSEKLQSNMKFGLIFWHKVAAHVLLHSYAVVGPYKVIVYDLVEWAVRNAKIEQLPILLPTWNSLVVILLNTDRDGVFWNRITEILRGFADGTDSRVYKFIKSVFELVRPADPFPLKLKTLLETLVQSTPASLVPELHPIFDDINQLSEQITGKHASETFVAIKDVVMAIEAKFGMSLKNQYSVFNKFRKNFDKFTKSQPTKSAKPKDDEFVFIPSKWQFRPDNLTEHQREKLKEKRTDIPALYNDMSQSQDSQSVSLKPWTPNKRQADPVAPPSEVIKCDSDSGARESSDSAKLIDDASDNEPPPNVQPSQSDDMASTILNTNTNTKSEQETVADQSTPGKVDDEERKRRRVQNELNKLQMAIANADQYSNQTRTRRMSINITKSEAQTSLRKRATTQIEKPVSEKRARRTTAGVSGSSESDSSEVIEPSQTLVTTPTTRRGRPPRTAKNPIPNDVKSDIAEPISKDKETSDTKPDMNVNATASVDSRSIDAQTSLITGEVAKSTEPVVEIPEDPNKTSSVLQENDANNVSVETEKEAQLKEKETLLENDVASDVPIPECKSHDDDAVSQEKSSDTAAIPQEKSNDSLAVPQEKSNDNVAVPQEKSNDNVAIPQEKITDDATICSEKLSNDDTIPQTKVDDIPMEVAHSEIEVAHAADTLLMSPVKQYSDENELPATTDVIITSPVSDKNCSKTTELLNSTIDISPIPHSKTSKKSDGDAGDTRDQPQAAEMECCNDNILDTDQIKRTDLDSLIKTPMDSLMLQKTYNLPANSTPQSHKDTKRKFQLQGRGAQLLQLSRKGEEAQKAKLTPVPSIESTMTSAENVPVNGNNLPSYEDILATNKDLFRFSKVLPYSPQASPSTSIMKRSIHDVIDPDDIDSPSGHKRKRVSFSDPPISTTKEFLLFDEEVNPNRLRTNRNVKSPLNTRNIILTRKNRVDSLKEIKKVMSPNDSACLSRSETSMKSLKFNDTHDDDINAVPLTSICNKDDALQQVLEEYPLEDVIGKYMETGVTPNDASMKMFSNQLTSAMTSDESKRKLILEDFSEKFPKEFLDVAFQENLASTVIERVPIMNMVSHVTDKAKIDSDVKQQLIEKLSSVFDDMSTDESEMSDDLFKLLLKIVGRKMNDKQLLSTLDVLFEKRRTNSCS